MQGPQPKSGFDVDHVLSQLKQNEKIALLSGQSRLVPRHPSNTTNSSPTFPNFTSICRF
jgi:hypothetical protein